MEYDLRPTPNPTLKTSFVGEVVMLCALGAASGPLWARDQLKSDPAKSPAVSSSTVDEASKHSTPQVKILKIEPPEAELGKDIAVHLSGFHPAWMDGDKLMLDKLVLVLGSYELKGLRPVRLGNSYKLMFPLESNAELADVWASLLAEPTSRTRVLPLAVGLEGQSESRVFARRDAFQMVLIPQYRLVISLVLVVLSFGLFIRLAAKTAILRDTYSCDLPATLRTYSLGKTQMAFWYLLVLAAFLFSWAVLGDYPTIPGPILSLIGIASGTALGAVVIDANKTKPDSGERAKLAARKSTLEADVKEAKDQLAKAQNDLNANPSVAADVKSNLDAAITQAEGVLKQKQAELDEMAKRLASSQPRTNGFVLDILTDDAGVSLHRFQMAVWTIVLGALFVIGVWQKFRMPEFDPTLLALMGISP